MNSSVAASKAGVTATAVSAITRSAKTVAIAGVLLSGIIAAGIVVQQGHGGGALASVARAKLAAAAVSLDPKSQGALVAEARACRAPLAMVTLSKAGTGGGGFVRIRSGSYVSPQFTVDDSVKQIAIPFPEPYAKGHGTIYLEGSATGVQLQLYPMVSAGNVTGPDSISVTWQTNQPCGE